MNKYKVIFTDAAQKAGRPKYLFPEGTSEDHALMLAGISRPEIVGIYLLGTENVASLTADVVDPMVETPIVTPDETPKTETPFVDPVVLAVAETFTGNGGDFGGAGASGSFDDSPSSSSSSDFSSDSSSSFDSGSSDSGSSGGGGE